MAGSVGTVCLVTCVSEVEQKACEDWPRSLIEHHRFRWLTI